MANSLFDFGMIGLGVMGRNLLLNMADHGFSAIGFDKDLQKGSTLESSATAGTRGASITIGFSDAEAMRVCHPHPCTTTSFRFRMNTFSK